MNWGQSGHYGNLLLLLSKGHVRREGWKRGIKQSCSHFWTRIAKFFNFWGQMCKILWRDHFINDFVVFGSYRVQNVEVRRKMGKICCNLSNHWNGRNNWSWTNFVIKFHYRGRFCHLLPRELFSNVFHAKVIFSVVLSGSKVKIKQKYQQGHYGLFYDQKCWGKILN